MTRRFLSLLLLAAAALTGCNSTTSESAPREDDKVSLFKEGKGVLFSDETKRLFGLETVEVTEKRMQRRLHKMAQLYRAGREGSPASAMLLLSAKEAKELTVGQPVMLQTDDATEISGTLVRLDAQTQSVLGQVEGLVEFADPQNRYPAGAFVTVTFTNGNAKAAFVVPESALLAAADGNYIYTVNGSHLTRTRVKPGAVDDGFVEIEDGLYAGDSVVVKGVDDLWLVELSALKGGTPCCPVPKKVAK